MPQTYEVGDSVRLEVEFRDATGALADPTAVQVKVEDPSGTETTYTDETKDAVGQYHKDILASAPGTWHYRWEGSGALVAISEGFFIVKRSAF